MNKSDKFKEIRSKSNIIRKFNKLKRDPNLFFRDSYEKNINKILDVVPINYIGSNNFTVVSAVYNVQDYLEDYFQSLTRQTMNFKSHIKLILVDDGSTDDSAAIIEKWQEKYPNNIEYIYKENEGQASARNLGLKHVKTEWITFIDPDDFLHLSYFENIDKQLLTDTNIKMIATNIKFFIEKELDVRDNHPLNYRFSEKNRAYPLKDLGDNVNFSAAASLFRYSVIINNDLTFDNRIKPNFEDGKFIADYLLYSDEGSIVFLQDSIYFYRKRQQLNSTIDSSWKKKEKFGAVLQYGFIPMLQEYQKQLTHVPTHIQRTALYDVAWYIKYLLNNSETINFLTKHEINNFNNLLQNIFMFINSDTIMRFNLAGIWFLQKVGMLGAFKNEKPESQIVYVEGIDKSKKQVLISYYTYFDVSESFRIDGIDVIPVYKKVVSYDFASSLFVTEKRFWIPLMCDEGLLTVEIDGSPAKITFLQKQHKKGIELSNILKGFRETGKYESNGSWVLMDRDIQADDNAEHLYRYIMTNHPKQQIYFALRKESHDWERLEAEGFNLIDFGTKNFEYHLSKSSKIISSHLDRYINNYFGDEYEYTKKFVFLQHGITKDDLSAWFNGKRNLQCIITATYPEYFSLIEDGGRYKLSEKEVVLTGFPRHDNLIRYNLQDNKTILIMPTWRQNIMGEISGTGNNRVINKGFMNTNYAQSWSKFLHSKILADLAMNYGYEVIFAPHANIEAYLELFEIPEYIVVWQASKSTSSMQQLFQNSKLMITDYSSVAFEMGLLDKTTIYYQFDREEAFSGGHIYQKGYFDYEKDGFGPVVTTEEDLLNQLEDVLKNNGAPSEPYATRIKNTFAYRDTNNCERVYQAIVALDEPETKELDLDILYDMTVSANDNEVWDLAESRSLLLIEYCDEAQIGEAQEVLNKALFNQNKFTELFAALESDNSSQDEINYWKAKVAYATTNWQEVIKLLSSMTALDEELKFMLLFSYAKTGKVAEFEKLKKEVQEGQLNEAQYLIIQAWSLRLCKQWQAIIDLLKNELSKFDLEQLTEYQPETLMAQAYRHLSDFEQAHQQLANFERHTKNNPRCRIEIARLAYSRDNYDKCIAQYNATVNGDIGILPQTAIQKYILSLWGMGNFDSLMELLPEMISMYPHNDEFRLTYVRVLAERSQWQELLEQASTLIQESKEKLVYPLTLARYRLGLIDEAYENAVKPTIEHSYEYWRLVAEIALLLEDTDLAKYCYKGMIAIYPAYDSSYNWSRFDSLKG